MTDDDELAAIRERKRQQLLGEDGDESAAGTPDEPVQVTGADHLDAVTSENRLVLVDAYADWCGPCKMMEPTIEDLAADEGLAVAKVDVDAHQFLAQQLGVQGVPTLFLYVDGDPVKRLVGAQDAATLRGLVEDYR